MSPISARLEEFMKRENLDPQSLSIKLGYDKPEKIYRLFREGNSNPSADILVDLSKTFEKLDVNWLLTGEGKKKTNNCEGDNNSNKPVTTSEVADMYVGVLNKLNDMHLSLNSGERIAKVNNSLIQTILLNQAIKDAEAMSSAKVGKPLTADKIFEASLSSARTLLEGTFGK